MRTRRVVALSCVLLLAVGVLAGLAIAADDSVETTDEDGAYPGNTLVTVQAYGWFDNYNGEAFIVTPEGERVWEYRPGNAAVFDGEVLDNGNVLVSFGQYVPASECPEDQETAEDHCIHNRVQEIDRETNEVVWEYDWWDRQFHYHEVHDADRLDSGETVIIDMGQHRTFTVNRAGEVTWEWSAIEHLGEGSAFRAEHVEGTSREDHTYTGPTQDWTHMNDVDRLPSGNFLMSIRNFDVLVEVDPGTDGIVRVIGEPGNHDLMKEQHDPQYLPESDNVIVADSENNRIVEYDAGSMAEVWRYEGPAADDQLAWPRDADRLPNGNTLIADSRNFRVLEVDEDGEVVWARGFHDERAIVYDVDRLGPNGTLDEEAMTAPSGENNTNASYGGRFVATAESWLGFVLPQWVGLPGALAILVAIGAAVGLAWEGVRWRWLVDDAADADGRTESGKPPDDG